MNIHMNSSGQIRGRIITIVLCAVMLSSLAAIPAFADDTYVVVGGMQVGYSGINSGYNTAEANNSGNTISQTPGIVIGGDSIADGIQANYNNQQTVVVNNNRESITVVSDGITSNTVTVSTGMANYVGAVSGNPVSNIVPANAAQTSTATDAGITVAASSVSGLRSQIFEMTNAFRRENGLSILSYNDDLQVAADTRAQESAVQFNHVRPDGSEAFTVVTVDYNITGENLVQAENSILTAEILMETWKNSGTHRMNLLHPSYKSMAVGIYQENGLTFVSQVFIG